ncbi:MAG: hypothetical protein C5S47_04795 [Candidatus Methanogasteraceae archaeon]|nr:MAG: hypothetical protein C5S47_04795 [ANME-2 cluster archaeon]
MDWSVVMVEFFADLIPSQRWAVLRENLKKVVILPQKTGQMRITDFL